MQHNNPARSIARELIVDAREVHHQDHIVCANKRKLQNEVSEIHPYARLMCLPSSHVHGYREYFEPHLHRDFGSETLTEESLVRLDPQASH